MVNIWTIYGIYIWNIYGMYMASYRGEYGESLLIIVKLEMAAVLVGITMEL